MHNRINQQISRALAGIRQAFRGVIGRADSTKAIQYVMLDGLAGEQLRDNEQFQEYGFTSNPLPGTMAVVIPLNGKTSHGIVIATEHGSYRLKSLAPGEVALYTDEGSKIVLKRGRIIETDCDIYRVNCKAFIVNAETSSAFNTPTLTASDQVISKGHLTGERGMAISGGTGATVDGSLVTTGDVVAADVSLINHTHPGDSGGVTGPSIPG